MAAPEEPCSNEGFVFRAARLTLGEFDIGGVLYHARYFTLYEQAREAFLEGSGVPSPAMAARGQYLAVVESHQTFSAPIRYGEPVVVTLTCGELSRTSVRFDYSIRTGDRSDPVHRGFTRHVFVETRDGSLRPARFPDELRLAFERCTAKTASASER